MSVTQNLVTYYECLSYYMRIFASSGQRPSLNPDVTIKTFDTPGKKAYRKHCGGRTKCW